jgi:hypothetical protein
MLALLVALLAAAAAAGAGAALDLPPAVDGVVAASAGLACWLTWIGPDAGPAVLRRLRRTPRVFLSHTSELRERPARRSYVEAAEAAVKSAGHAVIDMHYFTARDQDPVSYCREMIEHADIYVAIVGFQHGSVVDGERSYTEMEFQTATGLGRPRLVFLLDEELADPEVRPTDPIDRRQAAFRARLQHEAELTIHRSTSPDNLELRLFQSLVELSGGRLAFRYQAPSPPRPRTGGRPRTTSPPDPASGEKVAEQSPPG